MQTTNRKLGRAVSGGALLAGSAFIAALSFVAPSEALAACGGGTVASTGAKPPSTATGTHSGSTPSAGSTGTSSCGANTTSGALTSGTLTPSLAGVYTGAITGNGGKRNGSTTSSHTASTANTRAPEASPTRQTSRTRCIPQAAVRRMATSSTPESTRKAPARLPLNGRLM